MVAILAGAAASPRDAPGWVHGADAIGMGETGVAATGMAETGVAETGVAAIGTAATGMEIGVITVTIMSSSSAISAFQGGGAGAGDIHMDTVMGIRRGTTVTAMATRTDTAAMGTEGAATVNTGKVKATDTGPGLNARTACG